MTRVLKGENELREAGFTDIEHRGGGLWFTATPPGDRDQVCLLRQGRTCWHVFYRFRATASGTSPVQALRGGLGDALDTSLSLMRYTWLVRNAPESLTNLFDGLYAASQQVR